MTVPAPFPEEEPRAVRGAPDGGGSRELEQLVKATYADVWRLCATLVDEQAAEDLAQETFLRVARALHSFRGESSSRTWVLSIARHVCMDELRVRHRRARRDRRLLVAAEEGAHTFDPAADLAANEMLAHLGPERRTAFVLTQLLRLSYAEAAVVCKCPPGTIRSRVARARDDLIRLASREPRRGERGFPSNERDPRPPDGN
jgi:RNA polymerase sigma-70 factor, ECF subfamily